MANRPIVTPIVAGLRIEAVATPPTDLKMTPAEDIIARLRKRRRGLRVHQIDLARRISASQSSVGRWERRKAEPGLAALCAWAQELGMEVTLLDKDVSAWSLATEKPSRSR